MGERGKDGRDNLDTDYTEEHGFFYKQEEDRMGRMQSRIGRIIWTRITRRDTDLFEQEEDRMGRMGRIIWPRITQRNTDIYL